MPLFTHNSEGSPVRWTSKKALHALNEQLAAGFVAERLKNIRLRAIMTTDNQAWDDLLAAYQDVAEENERAQRAIVEMNRHITTLAKQRANDAAVLNESRRGREVFAERIANLDDENRSLRGRLGGANAGIDLLTRERDEARRLLGVANALNDCLDDGSYEGTEANVVALLDACDQADAERMAAVGRAGRLGTKRIRTILGRSS